MFEGFQICCVKKTEKCVKLTYLKLVEAMNLPDFGVPYVKNKIKNLRSTYNQEKKKVQDSKTIPN